MTWSAARIVDVGNGEEAGPERSLRARDATGHGSDPRLGLVLANAKECVFVWGYPRVRRAMSIRDAASIRR